MESKKYDGALFSCGKTPLVVFMNIQSACPGYIEFHLDAASADVLLS
ncbi:hypothetical protein [Polaromonas sp. CG_9.11]|nr:hypothetical protein [Polaromonas sp. CG_9.11]MBG6075308.1 hypothetical protein [Polaromonas sp. CG_9.11]